MGRSIRVGIFIFLFAISSLVRAGQFVNLGPQITASTLIGTTFTRDRAGNLLACSVMRGQPAKLVVFDLQSGKIQKILPLVGAEGAWNAVTASDHSVYVGTDSNGHLYRWTPGEDEAKDLGQVYPGQTWVWDLAAGKDGEVFLATYNGCRVVRYRPGEGFKEISNGPATPGEEYARAIAYDNGTGKIYVGVGSHAHLVEIDPATSIKREMLPPEYADQEFVYGVNVFGNHLFALVTNLDKSVVINLKTRKVETVLPHMSGQQVMTKSPVNDKVYYVVAGHLQMFDMSKPADGPTELISCPDPLAMTWQDNTTLVLFTKHAGVVLYDVTTGKSTARDFEKPSEPVVIQSMTLGPDGRIWMGGYLSGGNAAYDPDKKISTEYKGLSQAESIAVLGDSLYFGLYPHGHFAAYSTSKPWAVAKNNPHQLGAIDGQSRPFAGLGVQELQKVFFGTVPEYGTLGGGIATYDPAQNKLDFQRNIIPDQSIISLAYTHGLIAAGTSISGGLGIKPSQHEAKLFLWNPQTHEKIFETVPVPAAGGVSCLINGPDGNLWGVADGTLFIFDVSHRQILSRHKLVDTDYSQKSIWRDATLIIHPSGQIYGTLDNKFFRLDPASKQVTILRDSKGVSLLAMDHTGRLYFRQTVDLWQYIP